MTRKHRKQKISPTKSSEQKYQLYSAKPNDNIIPSIVTLALFAFGIGLWSEKQYFISLFCVSVSVWFVIAMITAVQSLHISGEKIIIDYVFTRDIFRAPDIEIIDWKTAISWRNNQPYRSSTFLLIQMTNGKKVEIPGSPYSRFDIRKALLDWRDKYKLSALENTEQEGISA